MKKKTLGIIGGVGPLATMYIGEMLVRLTDADTDQEHINMVITNNTTIPDRTAFILGESADDPVPYIISDANKLRVAEAEVLIMPCNTAHSFYNQIQMESDLPIINMIDETAARVQQMNAKRVGILATTGTISSGVYQDACEKYGLTPVLPDAHIQSLVMALIYDDVKAGKPADRDKWEAISHAMKALECDVLILGCTELSIVRKELKLEGCIDSLLVLAEVAIKTCGYQLK
ncbi:aspartate/glutamate racemase family protein [Sporosarcina sp. 6E9]|uniref:aspartate/glutamate racemase family protein n=1 Tax=Sporosarcina sp. 6E9 TaxID=2819235 RepID=UPI001B30B808|nr:amino acid racemase [Sporosarcina sp. 6E9]